MDHASHQLPCVTCTRQGGEARPFVTLNGAPGALPPEFAVGLVNYLRDTDDTATEEWNFHGADVLASLARQRPPTSKTPWTAREEYEAALEGVRVLAASGNAVVTLPGACRATRQFPNAFHVWFECGREHRVRRIAQWSGKDLPSAAAALEREEKDREKLLDEVFGPRCEKCGQFCHLTLNIDHLGSCPMVQIVGDTLLEWAASRHREHERRCGCRGVEKKEGTMA